MAELTPAQEAFAKLLSQGKTQIAAYVEAGYKDSAGKTSAASKLASNPKVIKRVEQLRNQAIFIENRAAQKAASSLGITKAWVLQRLKYNAERSLMGKPVLDKDGVQIPGRFSGKPEANAANRALELIGRELGMFVERLEVGGPGDFTSYTEAELLESIQEDAERIGMKPEAVSQLLLTYQGDGK